MFNFAKRTLSSITSQDGDGDFPDADSAEQEQEDSPEILEEKQRQELHRRIFDLWKKVWLGLYQAHDNNGPWHCDRLLILYAGAGMSTSMATESSKNYRRRDHAALGHLGAALGQQLCVNNDFGGGIRKLRLYDGLSLSTLESVIEILEGYEREIEPLGEVYAVLRRLQIGLREPSKADEDAVLRDYPPVADSIARRLFQYDVRLGVLGMQMYDEVTALHDDPKLQRGWLVWGEVFPWKTKMGPTV
ncbi:hypothetical protein DTO164E3_7254 [Paecilomyces variotii]|nr:hypothetical protein DTO164E3_7254 [Paecilomyces variotii]KAJ9198185.1 hypothetical protein DTO032I3_5601 [Paecilomyces variotii]KAJ9275926.1 hypothetical protein DTO021D3_7236 [Paecilomyces variotii]KAJ9344635.1 hypothetical protein DTO027B6_2817 [Paecilomyces variotii]KAJ9362509.1 hypothetical protein DTO027B9_186 [Paecilomyces variotii]